MNNFLNSFYGKLTAIFLFLLLLMGLLQIGLTVQSWTNYYSEADQKLNLDLARNMAVEFEPFLKDSIDFASIEHTIHYMMVINPKIEIYLLDDQGKVLAFFAVPQNKVIKSEINLSPIHDFINQNQEIPIHGDDPRHPHRQKPFTVAPIKIASQIDGYLYIILGGEQYDNATATIRENYLVNTLVKGLLIILIFTAFIGSILFFLLTRRLMKMTEVVKKFEQGGLDIRLPYHSKDEIGQLASSFNKMADTIVANIDDLKETDRLRRELIANISHDLRGPLASIRGYLETILIKDKQLDENERKKYIEVLLDTTGGLEELVEELFDLSKLDAKQVQPMCEPFAIKDLVYDVMMKFKPVADKLNIKLDAEVPDGLPQVFADIALIERVLSNLIENALRYTPEDGLVKIGCSIDESRISIYVVDTGYGISKNDLPHIFERFYRADKSRAQSTGGTGLGLAIANKIIELHESTISVVSELNKGSKFSFQLPQWTRAIG